MDKLKPCPFCGNKPTIYLCDGRGWYVTKHLDMDTHCGVKMTHCMVMCEKCRVRTAPYLTRRGMKNAWNRRTDDG